jgi:hypothetical protein
MKRISNAAVVLAALVPACSFAVSAANADEPAAGAKKRPFGLEKVVTFYGTRPELKCPTLVTSEDWRSWKSRGCVSTLCITHQSFLRPPKSVDEAANVLMGLDYKGNPNPVLTIDEFGWDYDGGIDAHTADVLKAVHAKNPGLKIAVWQMRGPVAPKLAAVYRDTVELVMMETYYDLNSAWMIPFQLQTARLNGILNKTIIGLGLGRETDGSPWTRTPEELQQQLALIRFVAPESPGVAFFGDCKKDEKSACQITTEQMDRIVGGFLKIPTDGTGLKPELLALGKTFTKHYDGPAIFCSTQLTMCYFHSGFDGGDWGTLHQPVFARVLMMNLGYKDAKGVKASLKDLKDVNKVLGSTTVDIPARSVVVVLVPGCGGWPGSAALEVNAPGGEVFNFAK